MWRLSGTSSVTAEPLVNWDWGLFAEASLRIWILCRQSTSRLSTDSVAFFPFYFVCHSPFPASSYFFLLFPLYHSFIRTLYNGLIWPPDIVLISVDSYSYKTILIPLHYSIEYFANKSSSLSPKWEYFVNKFSLSLSYH